MKLPTYVRPFPKYTNPFGAKGVTLFALGSIFLDAEVYKDLKKDEPDPTSVSLLLHEEEHRKHASWENTARYFFIPKFRITEEMNAYRVQFSYLKKHGATYDLKRIARAFSSPMYLWSMSYEEAMGALEKTWKEA